MKASLAAGISLLILLAALPARAISIHDFGRMNDDDESTYVALLVQGAAKHLKKEGHADQATKVMALFKDPGKNGGVNQFVMNLKQLDGQNKWNAINPNNRAPLYGVEDAMARTLKDNDIIVSVSDLNSITNDFKPSGPPRGHAPGT